MAPSFLTRLASGKSNCSVQALRKLSEYFCCTPGDLMTTPSYFRLAQIRLGYLMRQVEQQKAHVLELEIKQQEDLLL